MAGTTLPYMTRVLIPGESKVFVFAFDNLPEILNGATIVSAYPLAGPGGSALTGLTAGIPAVLTADRIIDAQGNKVAAGKGVAVAIFAPSSPGDDVIVEQKVTLSTGSEPVVQGVIAFRIARQNN